jgi:beta-lactamase class C
VNDAIRPVMVKDNIPGMAVGITVAGKPWVFNYGVASTQARKPVTGDTLFELGSVAKTFTATLASWAQVTNLLGLPDQGNKYLPSCAIGSSAMWVCLIWERTLPEGFRYRCRMPSQTKTS